MTPAPCGPERLVAEFGQVDIYLFDQLLRGRITPEMRVLDAGCGNGRNVHYLLRCGARVFGVDRNADAVARVRALAEELAPGGDPDRFQVADLEDLPFPDRHFDAVICSAVLHFARDESAFEAMLLEIWRVLRDGGLLFTRLASTIGIRDRVARREGRRFDLPDGTERFLVDEPYLLGLADLLGGELLDPLKTTNVQNRRAMTTWVLRKTGSGTARPGEREAHRLRTPELGRLLERLEAPLYRLPPWSEPEALGESDLWTGEDEAALAARAPAYGVEAEEMAGTLAGVLEELRARVALRARGAKGDAEREAFHDLLDRAKAALSGLKTLVLVREALDEEG